MTLDYTKTADDDTLIRTLKPLLAERIWHDGRRWWAKDHSGQWVRTTMTAQLHEHLTWAATQLPQTPYWDRSRHRLRTFASMYSIGTQIKLECWSKRWPKPADLAS